MTLPEHMRFCLTAPLPTSAWVGDDMIVHTNDAFAAFIGAELHAAVLGRPAREGFGALWAVLEPLVERAPTVATDVRLVLDRRGAPEEVFATIALSRSDDGIVCTWIDTTDLVLRRERVEVTRILARAVELAGTAAAKVDGADGVAVLADGERLASALAHLLVHGQRCQLSAELVGDRLRITIRDTRWKTDEIAPWLARDAAPATGFGLAVAFARTLVELHGGVIVAHDSSIVFELPAEVQVPVAASREEIARSKSRKRVLLVEDNDDAARSLKTALEMLGYDVAVAHDGPVALTVARAFRPDVALLDIGLPVMDGYELANRLRAIDAATRDLKVVAVTAYGTDEFRKRSREAGFAEHLVKPVDLARLERVVEAL